MGLKKTADYLVIEAIAFNFKTLRKKFANIIQGSCAQITGKGKKTKKRILGRGKCKNQVNILNLLNISPL